MSEVERSYKRSFRNYLINPRYQLRYVAWASFACVSLIFYFTTLLYTSVRQYHQTVIANLNPALEAQINADYNSIVSRLLIGAIVILIGAIVVGFYLSHRTAGPLYQLKMIFDRVRDGDLKARTYFRQEDDFRDVGDSFNSMMDSIEKKRE